MNELCDMVPACSTLARKPDKLTILRLAVAHMKALQGKLTIPHLTVALINTLLFVGKPILMLQSTDTGVLKVGR